MLNTLTPFVALLSYLPTIQGLLTHRQSFAPSSRSVKPTNIFRTTGNATRREELGQFAYTLAGPGASVTYDFGLETAGLPSIRYFDSSCGVLGCPQTGLPSLSCGFLCQGLGLAYAENAAFVSSASDQSTIFSAKDGTVFLPILTNTTYEVPAKWARGGFRFLTLSLGNTTTATTRVTVQLQNIYYTAAPDLTPDQLGSYTGYFNSSDTALDNIWYAGANTLQLCTVSANSSVQHTYVALGGGWSQDSTATGLTADDVFLADGAKRDRNPWAGDLSIALRTALMVQNYDNIIAVRNSLKECFTLQDSNPLSPTFGYFPYAGSPLGDLLKLVSVFIPPYGSDTYHLHTIKAFAEYVLETKDTEFLDANWKQTYLGIQATYRFVDTNGLFTGTRTLDWGRVGQGGQNIALNALYYDTLNKLVALAVAYPTNTPQADVAHWTAMATALKTGANLRLWDDHVGLYRDNTTAAGANIHPQDGNAFAVEFNVTDNPDKRHRITKGLAARLTQYGSPAPELPTSVSPFIGSHELIAQFQVAEVTGDTSAAMDLLRTQWGYMRHAFSNNSFVEGYSINGSIDYGFYTGAPSFVSHAHAWSTGPVYSLIHDVVGIHALATDVAAGDGDFVIKPLGLFSDLTHASGGVNVPLGSFGVSWTKGNGNGLQLQISSPLGLSGVAYIPIINEYDPKACLLVNGQRVAGEKEGRFYRVEVQGGPTHVALQANGC